MLAFLILAIINVTILMRIGQTKKSSPTVGGWTRKQLEHMKKAGKTHTFVDCDKEGCEGMDAYPTLVSPEGEKTVGYKEV